MGSRSLSKFEITFGKHKGKALEDIPASYLLWLADQQKPPPEVALYVKLHRKYLEEEKYKKSEDE